MAEIKRIGVVSTYDWLVPAKTFVMRQGYDVLTALTESIIGENNPNSEVNRRILDVMIESRVNGILAEFTGGELLKKEYMRVGDTVPMVVTMDWVVDRKRRDTREMEQSGLAVVRYDLARIDGLDEVVRDALELLEMKMR